MHDLKHVTEKKSLFSLIFKKKTDNRRIESKRIEPFCEKSKGKKRYLRYILPFIAILLAGVPVSGLVADTFRKVFTLVKASDSTPQTKPPTSPLTTWQSFQFSAKMLPEVQLEGNYYTSRINTGGVINYTFNQRLQSEIEKQMKQFKVPYALFIAMDPKTGEVLAMASHSETDPSWADTSYYSLYPMASLFKIITASAALEQKKVSPESVIEFRGKLTSENPKHWAPGKKLNNQMGLGIAMGKSVNPVFGRVANDFVGKETLLSYTERFGFNQNLFPETPVMPSRATVPQTREDTMLMGAGLGREVKLSPFHAAAIISSIANKGLMMAPILARNVTTADGKIIYSSTPQALRQIVSEHTAKQLSGMLATTVQTGTSRKAFHDRRGRKLLNHLTIAAKTGSIDGSNPKGHYSWFAGYAPVEDPKIALVTLVINEEKWKIKASYLGEKGFEAFFRE